MTRPSGVPWWGLVSSAAGPVLLIGGWTLAASRQRDGFDPVVETISDLAAYGADDRWVMTAALAGLGVCHVVTAAALRDAATAGRVVLAAGGVATVLVAVFPLPVDDHGSTAHTLAAGTSFLALAVWPAAAGRPGLPGPMRRPGRPGLPGPLRRSVSLPAAAALLGLVGWFFAELVAGSGRVGLSERVAAGAQSVWPLVAAWGARRWRG